METTDLTTAGHHRDAPAVMYRIDHAGKSMTFSGEIADESRARRLVLAHLSPTIENARCAVEASSAQRYKGLTRFASDGLHVVP